MAEIVALESFSLAAQGSTISLRLGPGQSLAVVGPASSGKSRLLRCLCGTERAGQGTVHVVAKPKLASKDGFNKRSSPQSILRHAVSGGKNTNVADALLACGLWEVRQKALKGFSSSQIAACEMLACLGPETRLLLVDGQLDRLDPWTLNSVLVGLRQRLLAGAALVAVTNRPELISQFDFVVVLDNLKTVYAGPVEEMLRFGPKAEVEVRSQMQPGAKAMVAPFKIAVEHRETQTVFQAENGQELAAKLLLEGYGDVDYVVVRQPSIEEALMHLTRTSMKKLKN
ncbi:MAG TPA: ATP-binding cassette domain-containing protein [Fimbriimonadaceae bacterium]|jgi:ABC-type multidrug transport system ATPase subunit